MPTYSLGSGVQVASGSSAGANTNQGSGQVPQGPKKHKQKRRVVNGQVQYQWPNGTWHSRKFGKKFRSNAGGGGGGENSGGGGGGTGGAQAPKASKHPLLDQANALGNIQYGGAEQSLVQRGQAIPVWYQNYMNDVTAAQQQSQAYAAPIQQQAEQRAQQAGQTAPGLDPNTPAGQDATLAAAARQALGQAFVTTLQGVGQAQNNYLAGRKAVAATSEIGAQQQLASDKTALKKEKGAFVTAKLGELRADKRQEKLENAAFGLDVAKEQGKMNKYGYTTQEWNSFSEQRRNRIRNKAAKPKTSGPDLGKVNQYGITEKKWRSMSEADRQDVIKKFKADGKKPGDGADQFTPTQRHATKKEIRKGIAAVKSTIGGPGYTAQAFWARAKAALINEKGYDPLLANAIIQRMRTGRVTPQMAKRLKKNYGITLGSGKKVTLPTDPSSTPVVGGVIGLGS